MGAYQIRFLERVPKRAVVDDAVELTKAARKRSAAGFVNAVLRKCEPPKDRSWGATLNTFLPRIGRACGAPFRMAVEAVGRDYR